MIAVELTCYHTSNHKHADDISVHCQTHGIVDQSESWLPSPRNEKKKQYMMWFVRKRYEH